MPAAAKTTRATLAAHLEHISFTALPRNFRDAILVALRLGLDHLWIDSLCIVQDDEADWSGEAPAMADVYSGAELTIVASRSSGATQGFLHANRDRLFTQRMARFPGQDEGDSDGDGLWLQLNPKPFLSIPRRESPEPLLYARRQHLAQPLCKRAWALQERVLSHRAVLFDSTQMMWECRSARYFEGWTSEFSNIQLNGSHRKQPVERMSKPDPTWGQALVGPDKIKMATMAGGITARHKWWYAMLHEHRARDLTFDTDLLPAIAGLANACAKGDERDRYCAGLWYDSLLVGLTWRFDSSALVSHTPRIMPPRDAPPPSDASPCYAPSWSWASASAVRRDRREFRSHSTHRDIFWNRDESLSQRVGDIPRAFLGRDMEARVLDLQLMPGPGGIYGPAQTATLLLEGPHRRLTIKSRPMASYYTHRFFEFAMDGLDPPSLNQYYMVAIDSPHWLAARLDSEPLLVFDCLLLGFTSGMHCLILEKVREGRGANLPAAYTRVGVLNNEMRLDDFQDGWETGRFLLI
jgi:hypothetical protein